MLRNGSGHKVPRKPRTVIAGTKLPPKKPGMYAPIIVPKKRPKASARSIAPRKETHVPLRKRPMIPMWHVDLVSFHDRDAKAYWTAGPSMGDLLVAMLPMDKIRIPENVSSPYVSSPVHPYLYVDNWLMNQVWYVHDVPQGSLGFYAGSLRVLERSKTGDVAVIRHTVIFPSGRYIITDLNAVLPVS